MQNKTLIKTLKKAGVVLHFNKGINTGAAIKKDKDFKKNESLIAKHVNQIKGLTETEWNTAINK